MNIIFLGSSEFAVPALRNLLATDHIISCVVTQPDREKGRGLYLAATPIKALAKDRGISIYQPGIINTAEAVKFLKSLQPDLFLVVSYGQILSEELLNIPKIFAINTHASLLPKYRGAAPINWAIINGDKISGVTIIKIIKKMDAGPIILQKGLDITEDDTAITLENKLSELAAQLITDSLLAIERNNYKLMPQDESKASLAPKLQKQDGLINWHKSAAEINNLIRGCLDWPGAFTYCKGKLLKIYNVGIRLDIGVYKEVKPGEIVEVSKNNISVFTDEGILNIKELQVEGKRRMKAEEFIAGHKISVGEFLGNKE